MKQTVTQQLTYAAPTAVVALSMADSVFSKLTGVRMIGETDNASANVQVQMVVSRSSAPVGAALATEKALSRGDALLLVQDIDAGRAMVAGSIPDRAIIDTEQLFDSAGGAYLGLKVVGLESGKVVNLQVELTFGDVAKTTTNTGAYLQQVVTFQAVGT